MCHLRESGMCSSQFQRVCSFYAPSQDAAGSQQLDSCSSEKRLFLISADPTPALATSVPLRFRSPSPLSPRFFRRTPQLRRLCVEASTHSGRNRLGENWKTEKSQREQDIKPHPACDSARCADRKLWCDSTDILFTLKPPFP